MNKIVPTLVVAMAGAAAASLVAAWRSNKREAKEVAREAIHRWEDDGGNIPAPQPRTDY